MGAGRTLGSLDEVVAVGVGGGVKRVMEEEGGSVGFMSRMRAVRPARKAVRMVVVMEMRRKDAGTKTVYGLGGIGFSCAFLCEPFMAPLVAFLAAMVIGAFNSICSAVFLVWEIVMIF